MIKQMNGWPKEKKKIPNTAGDGIGGGGGGGLSGPSYLCITSFSDPSIIGAAEEIIWSPGDFDLPETSCVALQRDLRPAGKLDMF